VAEGITLTLAWRRLKKEKAKNALEKIKNSRNSVLLGILLENGVDALGVSLAFSGFGLYMLTGNPYWDAGFSLIIAMVLTTSSIFLIKKNQSLLTGETVIEHDEMIKSKIILDNREVKTVTKISLIALGPETYHCSLSIKLKPVWYKKSSANQTPSAAELISLTEQIKNCVTSVVHGIDYIDVSFDHPK